MVSYVPGVMGPVMRPFSEPPPGPSTYMVQAAPHQGTVITFAEPTAADTAPTGEGIGLLVDNGADFAVTVTLPITRVIDGQTVASRVITVAAGALELIPLPSSVYGTTGTPVTYSMPYQLLVAVICTW